MTNERITLIKPPRFRIQRRSKRWVVEMLMFGNFDFLGRRDEKLTYAINRRLFDEAKALGSKTTQASIPIHSLFYIPSPEAAEKMLPLLIAAMRAWAALPVLQEYLCHRPHRIDPAAEWKVDRP